MLVQFYVWCRWVRLTIRRHGLVHLVTGTRTLHCACGRAHWGLCRGRAHGASTGYQLRAYDLIRQLQQERECYA